MESSQPKNPLGSESSDIQQAGNVQSGGEMKTQVGATGPCEGGDAGDCRSAQDSPGS